MIATSLFPRGRGSPSLRISFLLFGLFALQATYYGYRARHLRLEVDVDLSAELLESTILDEANASTNSSWPQWRGPHRDGTTSAPKLRLGWPSSGPLPSWEKPLGLGYSSFAIAQKRMHSLFQEDEKEFVACWNADDGEEIWRYAFASPSHVKDYPGPRSTPTLEDNRLYVVGSAGKVVCLDAAKGEPIWQRELMSEFQAAAPRWGVSFSPLIDGDLLFVAPGGASGNAVAALNKRNGETVWKALDASASYSSPIAATIGGVRQILFFLGDCIVGVAARDGKLCWRYPWGTPFEVNAATPLVFAAKHGEKVNHYVFFSSGYGQGCALLKIAALRDGGFEAQQVYRGNQMCSHFASPVRRGDYFYGIDDSRLICLDIRTGKVQWTRAGINKGSLLRVDNWLLTLGENGKLTLLEASPERKDLQAEARVFRDGRCWTMPVLVDGFLYVRNDRSMKCLDVRAYSPSGEEESSLGK